MREKPIYILLILLFSISCQPKNGNNKSVNDAQKRLSTTNKTVTLDSVTNGKTRAKTKKETFTNYFRSDSSIDKNAVTHRIVLSNKDQNKELAALYNCAKNVKKNSLKIQITAAMPTSAEIKKGITGSRLFSNIGPENDFKGQLKFLTFYLKDSTITKIQLLSKSTDKEYNGSDFKYSDIEKYQVVISKFDYSIASNVFGKYKIILPESFGYIKNDTIMEGTFQCNNWRINEFDNVKEWDLEKWNEAKKRSYGFRINE